MTPVSGTIACDQAGHRSQVHMSCANRVELGRGYVVQQAVASY